MVLNTFAYIIIPVYTVLFVKGTNIFTTNFSVIGSWATRKNAFVLWGIIVGCYIYYTLKSIIRHLPRSEAENGLCHVALALLALAVLTPYLPEDLPFQALMHVFCAFTSSLLLLACLYRIVWRLYKKSPDIYRAYLTSLHTITALSAVLLVLAGIVSSALEIFFTISCVVLIRLLYGRVSESESPFSKIR